MKKLITEEQQREIVQLAADHADALVAYGADMYRDGLIKGATAVGVGALIGVSIAIGWAAIKTIKNTKIVHKKEES